MPPAIYPPDSLHSWTWQNREISYAVAGPETAPAVVLIHGFGACKEHWRHNLPTLAAEYRVYAIDLIGFGASSKPTAVLTGEEPVPGGITYGIGLWASQLVAFVQEVVQAPVVLIGNSIGGVVALRTARELETLAQAPVAAVLIDCAQRAIDDKQLSRQPAMRRLGRPLLKRLIREHWLTDFLFRTLARPGIIRRILQLTYPSGGNVDDQLVEALVAPTRDPGATESFRGFANLFNDDLAVELLAAVSTPVHLIWGTLDPWEAVSEARSWQHFDCVRDLRELPGLGHCPHDEAPEQVNPLLSAILRHYAQTP